MELTTKNERNKRLFFLTLVLNLSSFDFLPIDQSQDVEHGGDVGVVMSRCLLQVLQGLLAEGHGHLVPALRGVLDHKVVQGSQAGRDLIASLLGCSHGSAVVLVLHCGRKGQRSQD